MPIMPTSKKRLNLSLSKELEEALAILADRDDMPAARKAVELLETALAIEEDQIWDQIAESRDTKGATFVSHKEAWS